MIVDCAVYRDGRRRGGALAVGEAAQASGLEERFVWIGGTSHPDELDWIRRSTSTSSPSRMPTTPTRPKLAEYGDCFSWRRRATSTRWSSRRRGSSTSSSAGVRRLGPSRLGQRARPRAHTRRGTPADVLAPRPWRQHNEDVRRISARVAIIAVPNHDRRHPPNLEHMPELRRGFGWRVALAVTAGACLRLWRCVKRVGCCDGL